MFVNFNLVWFSDLLSKHLLRFDFNFKDVTWLSPWFSVKKFVPVNFVHFLHLLKLAKSLLNLFESFVMVCLHFFQLCHKFSHFKFIKNSAWSDQANDDKNPYQRLLFRSLWLIKHVRMRRGRNLFCWWEVVILVLILLSFLSSLGGNL